MKNFCVLALVMLPLATKAQTSAFAPGPISQIFIGAACQPLNEHTSGHRVDGYYTVTSGIGWVVCTIPAYKQTGDADWTQVSVTVSYTTPGADSILGISPLETYDRIDGSLPPMEEFGCVLDDRHPDTSVSISYHWTDEFHIDYARPFEGGQQVLCLLPRDGAVTQFTSVAQTSDSAATSHSTHGGVYHGVYGLELAGSACYATDEKTNVSRIGGRLTVTSNSGWVSCPIPELSFRIDTPRIDELDVWYRLPEALPSEYGCFVENYGPDSAITFGPEVRARWASRLRVDYYLNCHLPRGGYLAKIVVRGDTL